MTTIKNILETPLLYKLKIVAGKEGINRQVGYVTVMEVPDIVQWLKGNDFLITSFYAIKDDLEAQCQLVESLVKAGSAGLAVKVGSYIHSFSPEIIEIANKHQFPLIEIPYDMTYVEIISNVTGLIFEEKQSRGVAERYLKSVVMESYDNPEDMIIKGMLLGIPIKTHYFTTVTLSIEKSTALSEKEIILLDNISSIPEVFAKETPYLTVARRVVTNQHLSVFLGAEHKEQLDIFVKSSVKRMAHHLSTVFPNQKTAIGIGIPHRGLKGIRSSYFESQKAIGCGRVFFENEQIYEFQNLEIYSILQTVLTNQISHVLEDIFKKINNEEIIDTLVAYYDLDGDLDAIANKLYIHRNTVNYRLRRVKELTGLDMKTQSDNLKLHLAVLSHKIQQKKK